MALFETVAFISVLVFSYFFLKLIFSVPVRVKYDRKSPEKSKIFDRESSNLFETHTTTITTSSPFSGEKTYINPLHDRKEDLEKLIEDITVYRKTNEGELSREMRASLKDLEDTINKRLRNKKNDGFTIFDWPAIQSSFNQAMKYCPDISEVEKMGPSQATETFHKCYDLYEKELGFKTQVLAGKMKVEDFFKEIENLKEEMESFVKDQEEKVL